MATDLERLVVSLSADIKSYEKALAKAQGVTTTALRKIEADSAKSMGRFEKTMGRGASALAGFGKGLVLGGIATAVAGLGAIVTSSISTAAAIGDLSEKLGITSTKLQEIQFGAVQANLGFEEMESGLLKFSKALGQAQNGSGDLLKTLEANGFTKAQVKALSYSDALDVVADLIKNAKNEQDALLITLQAFGKGGDGFLELLRNGSKGLKEVGTAAHDASAVIDKELIASAQKFDDAWARATQGAKSSIANWSLSAITELAKFGNKAIEVSEDFQKALGLSNNVESFGGTKMSGSSQAGAVASPKGDRQATTVIFDPEAEAAAKRAREEAAKAYAAQQKAISGVIEALKFENEQLARSELAQAIATEQRRAGVTAASEQGKAIAALVTKNYELTASQQSLKTSAERQLELDQELYDSKVALAQAALDAFDAIAIGGEKASDVIKDLASSLLKAAVQASLFGSGPLASIFGTSGGGGIFGSLFNAPKLYAKGGQIPTGQVGIAGEAGPELIQGPANVIPFNKLRGSGSNVQIIDQRTNAPAVEQQRGSDGSLKFIIRDAVNDIIGSGQADSALRNRHGLTPQKARR